MTTYYNVYFYPCVLYSSSKAASPQGCSRPLQPYATYRWRSGAVYRQAPWLPRGYDSEVHQENDYRIDTELPSRIMDAEPPILINRDNANGGLLHFAPPPRRLQASRNTPPVLLGLCTRLSDAAPSRVSPVTLREAEDCGLEVGIKGDCLSVKQFFHASG